MTVNKTGKNCKLWGQIYKNLTYLGTTKDCWIFPQDCRPPVQSGNDKKALCLFSQSYSVSIISFSPFFFKVHDRVTMHSSIYYFNQRESKVRLPRELHRKTNAIFLLITALTRSRQSWRTYQGGEPVQVLDNCQLCQWLRLLFYCASLCFTAGLHLCPTLMIAFKSPLSAEDCTQTQRSLGKGFSMLTVVDYG